MMSVLLVCRALRLYNVEQENLRYGLSKRSLKESRKEQPEERKIRRWMLFWNPGVLFREKRVYEKKKVINSGKHCTDVK